MQVPCLFPDRFSGLKRQVLVLDREDDAVAGNVAKTG